MLRALGLDYGEKTIGVAISDKLGATALPLTVIRRESEEAIKKSVAAIIEIMRQENVNCIVLGYPINLDGSESVRSKKTLEFKERLLRNFKGSLKATEIFLWDERFTTTMAAQAISHLKGEKRKEIVDAVAAAIILQGFMEANKIKFKENENERI